MGAHGPAYSGKAARERRRAVAWTNVMTVNRAQQIAALRWPDRVVNAGTAAKLARRFSHLTWRHV